MRFIKRLTRIGPVSVAVLLGCAEPIKMAGTNTSRKPGLLTVRADWVKDKPEKFDTALRITNESPTPLLIFTGDITCARGPRKGLLNIEGNPRLIDLREGEIRQLILKCALGDKTAGDFSITMSKIFTNPKQDSATPGELAMEHLVWSQGQREGKRIY